MFYLYIRSHESYEKYNCVKIGKTINPLLRDFVYSTSEINRGKFIKLFKTYNIDTEKIIKQNFNHLNFKLNAGTEFYKKDIIDLIEPFLKSLNIEYKIVLLKEEKITRDLLIKYYYKLNKKRIEKTEILEKTEIINKLENSDSSEIIKTPENSESSENIKTPENSKSNETNTKHSKFTPRLYQQEIIKKSVSYFSLHQKGILVLICGTGKTLISLWIAQALNCKSVIICVPSIVLKQQWEKVIKQFSFKSVITTYHSSHKYTTSQYDIKILDEVHHVSSSIQTSQKEFIECLKIPCKYQLSLTATLKSIQDPNTISNDKPEYFGDIIETKKINWAISNKIICDYTIQTILSDISDPLFLAAISAIKSILSSNTSHILIYTNTQSSADTIISHISKLQSDPDLLNLSLQSLNSSIPDTLTPQDFIYFSYHSKTKNKTQLLSKFTKSKYGIITCVYCLGEGWDFPVLDGVLFAEPMTSNIRIIQAALRSSRLNPLCPGKVSKIILPIYTPSFSNNEDIITLLKKSNIFKVFYEMQDEVKKTLPLKIDCITQNILNPNTQTPFNPETFLNIFNESHRLSLQVSYSQAKNIIKTYTSIKSISDYLEICKTDLRLNPDPEVFYSKSFESWEKYLNLTTLYISKKDLIKHIKNYITTNNIKLKPSTFKLLKQNLHNQNPEKIPQPDLWEKIYNNDIYKDLVKEIF